MFFEIQTAVNYLTAFLYGNVPRRKVDLFAEQLVHFLINEFGVFCDCLSRTLEINYHGRTDATFAAAATCVALDLDEVLSILPGQMIFWIASGQVHLFEGGVWSILYNIGDPEHHAINQMWVQGNSFNSVYIYGPVCECQMSEWCSNKTVFTVAEFASTRFGSLRPKSENETGFRHRRNWSPNAKPTSFRKADFFKDGRKRYFSSMTQSHFDSSQMSSSGTTSISMDTTNSPNFVK